MPRISDDDSDDDSRRGERKVSGDKQALKKADSKEFFYEKRSQKDEEIRRNLKWISFSKPRMVFGFDHLGTNNVPLMSNKTRGISMSFEKISGWHVPPQVYQDLGLGSNQFEFTLQLSLSMFHLNSSSFFGSTWMGRSVPLGSGSDDLPDLIDLEYNEIVYLISRLADPSCIGVVEIVVSKILTKKKLVTAQYGCGWTIINLFALLSPPEIENGHENVKLTSCPFFQGSPRDLALNSNVAILKSRLKELSGCTLQFKLYSQKKLLKAQRLIAENEALGRFDIVAGIASKLVTLPDTTMQRELCCIGDEELVVQGTRGGGVFLIPTSPFIAIPITLNMSDCQVHIPDRFNVEARVRATVARNMAAASKDVGEEAQIISRTLKIGLHNGHTVVGGEWQSVVLREDRDDRDVLLTKQQTISINGYVPHELMAIALLLEYEVGVPVPERTQHSAHTILNSTVVDGKVVSIVTLGVSIYIPFNGEKMILRNNSPDSFDRDATDEELGVELALRSDEVCTILSPKPLFADIDNTSKILTRKSARASKRADGKSRNRDRDSDEEGGSGSDEEGGASSDVAAIKVAFDLTVVDSSRGDIIREIEGSHKAASDVESREDDADTASSTGDRSYRTGRTAQSNRESTINSRKGISISTAQRKRRVLDGTGGSDNDDDNYSVSDAIVGGDSKGSNLLLDPHLYAVHPNERRPMSGQSRQDEQDDRATSNQISSQFAVPRDKGSLLAQTMQAKLNSNDTGRRKAMTDNRGVLDDNDGDNSFPSSFRALSSSSAMNKSRSAVTFIAADGAGGQSHSRELTRGARSRLGRHGFDGTIMDSNASYGNSNDPEAYRAAPGRQIKNSQQHRGSHPVDVALEARDLLTIHDITIQFAGYRIGPATADTDSSSVLNPHPRSVYCSYQFYTCQPTRTEVMRLLSSDQGQLSVLCREEAHARDEAPLSLRYLIDCADASPMEAFEFADYLAYRSLFVDIWDADSLMLLGTCSIPLRRIMRQGQSVVRCAVECDVMDTESSTRTVDGITTSVIQEGGVGVGTVVGAIQVILSNRGDQSSNKKGSKAILNSAATEGLNWRAHQDEMIKTSFGINSGRSRPRPKVSVRARPLSENAPELSQALLDHRLTDGQGKSMRSLTSSRGQEGSRTLTYDDVAILFKRFQGDVKGTVQYSGTLMTLLDIPSSATALRKLVKAYQLAGSGKGLEKEMVRYTSADGKLNAEDLSDCLRTILERHGIAYREGEIGILVHQLVKGEYRTASEGGPAVEISDVLEYCKQETDRQGWLSVSKRIRNAVQKAYVMGVDVEQLLVERDIDGDHFLTPADFSLFLRNLSTHGKLSSSDMHTAVTHFSRKQPSGSRSTIEQESVSLKEVMAFFGKQYVGNITARIRQCIISSASNGRRTSAEVLQVLRSSSPSKKADIMSIEELEAAFGEMGVYSDLSHEQVEFTLKSMDSERKGKVGYTRVFEYLGIPLPDELVPSDDHAPSSPLNAEALLRLLLEQVQRNGLAVDEAFRHFDCDGNGFITRLELEEGLSQLGIFDNINIKNWRSQIPDIIVKFDKSGDGNVSLNEFFIFLGVESYAPNIIQRMTKIFALATEKGLSFKDIFTELDQDEDGKLDATELRKGLLKLGTFGEVSVQDAETVVKQFDHNGDQTVSLTEFIAFFSSRVNQAATERLLKKEQQLIAKFGEVMAKALEKGVSVEDLFSHFDKDKGGSVTTTELATGLRTLPHFKTLSDGDIKGVIAALDVDGNGDVSLKEFRIFISKASSPANSGDIMVSNEKAAMREGNSSEQSLGQPQSSANRLQSQPSKEIFRDQLRRIAKADGGIEGLLAYLDEDEDGVISSSTFMRLLSREQIYQYVSEADVEDILDPMIRGTGSNRGISVAALLRMFENEDGDKGVITTDSRHQHVEDDEDENDKEALVKVEYDFSVDPETRSLEKKLRGLGHALCKKGMDIEAMFRAVDVRQTGMVRRTEFVEIMSKMGLSILEKGKAMDEAQAQILSLESGEGSGEARRLQIQQMKRLKGSGFGYSQNAPRAARNLLMKSGSEERKETGDFKEHLESMALISWYRQSQKRVLLQKVLSHSLASTVRLYPRFGQTLFFEQPLTNPFGHEERFLLSLEDSELRLVTSFDEWLHLRQSCRPCTGELGSEPVEAEMFDRDGYGNVQVALLPHETLHIPFTFMTLVPFTPKGKIVRRTPHNHQRRSLDEVGRSVGEGKSTGERGYDRGDSKEDNHERIDEEDEEEAQRIAEVRVVSCTHGHVVAVIRVLVLPRPFLVHRTLRFFEPENGVMRRRIQLKTSGKNSSVFPGDSTAANKFVHCVEMEADKQVGADERNLGEHSSASQSRVVVEWGPSGGAGSSSGALDVLLRYRCGTFPSLGSFFLLIYDDPHQSELHEIWHVIIQSRQRIDLHASLGGTSSVDLVVRGDRFARRAHAYASHCADKITFEPKSSFQLVPGAFNRVALQFSPCLSGVRRIQMNLVDTDSKELISAWLLTVSAAAPTTTRNYDVDVMIDRPIHKKIIFKNPWDTVRRFALTSSNEAVMRPRVPILEVSPHGNAYLRLWFAGGLPNTAEESVREAFLFLNDETGQNEESFLFSVRTKI